MEILVALGLIALATSWHEIAYLRDVTSWAPVANDARVHENRQVRLNNLRLNFDRFGS